MTQPAAEEGQAGFSLVEMLVSLALVSLMAVYALSALSSLKNAERVSWEVAAQDEVDAVAEFMKKELSSARLHLDLQNSQNPKLMFDGQSNRVSFVTAGDTRREVGGLYLVTYWLDGQGKFVVTRKILSGASQYKLDVTLLKNVASVSFSYANEEGSETDTWEDRNSLPHKVAVEMTYGAGDSRRWRILDAAPELSN